MRAARLAPLVAVVIAGCGSGSSDHPKTSTAKAGATTPASSPATGKPTKRTKVTTPPPKGIAAPRKVETSGKDAAAAVEKVVGPEMKQGQPTVIGARCRAGNCVVRYRSQARGGGVVLQIQDDILKRLFARPSVRTVTLYVHHQQVGTPQKNEAGAFATAKCKRSGRSYTCATTHVAGGKQRSLIRRGLLSNKEASKGKGEPTPAGGPPPK
jgi:hypothetical protein